MIPEETLSKLGVVDPTHFNCPGENFYWVRGNGPAVRMTGAAINEFAHAGCLWWMIAEMGERLNQIRPSCENNLDYTQEACALIAWQECAEFLVDSNPSEHVVRSYIDWKESAPREAADLLRGE